MSPLARLIPLAATLLAAAPASAAIYTANFTGSAITTTGTSVTPGSTVSGSFAYNTATNSFTSFTVGGYTAPTLPTSVVSPGPGAPLPVYEALYTYQSNAAQQGTDGTTSFNLTLQSVNNFTASTGLSILSAATTPAELATTGNSSGINPLFVSSFSYTAQSSAGGGTTLMAELTSLQLSVTGAPEPASLALLAVPMLALAVRRRA